MIRFSVFYPSSDGARFDLDYWVNTHVPLAAKTWGIDDVAVDKGLNGPYLAAVHFTFESQDAMNAALGLPGTADVMADMANYTDISPVTQTSEVLA